MARRLPDMLQRVLDFFEDAPVAAPSAPSPAVAPLSSQPVEPLSPHVDALSQPAEPLSQVLPPPQFHHPRARRRILLGHTEVAYAFARSRRRTIGMAIGPEGLEVRAPRWVGLGEVESALREKADWIVRKLQESFERQTQLGAARIRWQDGCEVPYLGGVLRVVLDSGVALRHGSAQYEASAAGSDTEAHASGMPAGHMPGASAVLRIGLPLAADEVQIREAVQAWLMKQARALFIARLNHYAPLLGVRWDKLSLSNAATRWGSAGRDREGRAAIRLNWRLIHHTHEVIDYVVAHELSHLRVMDHSPRFWDTVGSVMPDYAERRRVLRDQPLVPWS